MSAEEHDWGVRVFNEEGEFVGNVVKNRLEFVKTTDWSLEPDSLVGSWFLALVDHDVIWQGVIVGEPRTGDYLCHIDVLEPGVTAVQRLFTLDTLMGLGDEARRLVDGAVSGATAPVVDPVLEFRLYDSEDACTEAFRAWAKRKTGALPEPRPDAEEVHE